MCGRSCKHSIDGLSMIHSVWVDLSCKTSKEIIETKSESKRKRRKSDQLFWWSLNWLNLNVSSPFTTTLACASLEPMWLVATHLYVPLSPTLTWAISSLPSLVISAPAGMFALPTRLHVNWMGWVPWARHCTRRVSPGWSLTWSGRQVAYGGAAWRQRRPLLANQSPTSEQSHQLYHSAWWFYTSSLSAN